MPSYKQAGRLMQFASPLPTDVLLIQTLEGAEGMSRLFDYQAELLVETGTDVDPASLVGKKATIAISVLASTTPRYINGLIAGFEQTSGDSTFDVYRVHLVPSLWQLTLTTNCKVFQDMMPMDIIKAVISPYGLSVSDKTSSAGVTLEYCTQYNETDFNFISRIAEQYGIFYWFQHSDSDNTVVFGNTRDGYDSGSEALNYSPPDEGNDDLYQALVSDIRATAFMVTGGYTYRDYDPNSHVAFTTGPVNSAQAAGVNAFEKFQFPEFGTSSVKKLGSLTSLQTKAGDDDILGNRKDAGDVAFNTFHGVSTSRSMFAGTGFTLAMHPREAWNQAYLLTEVSMHAIQAPAYFGTDSASAPLTTQFAAIESTRLFRPVARTPKPRISGPQSAFVVVPSGEEMFVDAWGRVCVQFYWDRVRQPNTTDNTMVRVAQPWAGSGWGTYFWPRGGDEVLVQFLNGDPDAPIIIGSVYNGVNVPKYKLPDMSTMTGVLTRSSKGGAAANANELRFEDKKSSEEIYINAEKDMNVNVENDNYRNVGNNEVVEVKAGRWMTVDKDQNTVIKGASIVKVTGNSSEDIGGNYAAKIGGNTDIAHGGNLTEKTGGNFAINVGGNHMEKVGMVYAVDSGEEVHLKGGMTVVVESGMNLCLKGAGGFITIGPAGVMISGTMVMINSGGAAVPGSPATVMSPQAPTAPADPPKGSWRDNS
ncbi:MAG TPA: type VI secretion system tip protein TssI/VgrG [Acidobacteriaceae bacterium]|nr:type VI secretion system tip protein TssI/VgrG [Acidobacteriaceae bacterium]